MVHELLSTNEICHSIGGFIKDNHCFLRKCYMNSSKLAGIDNVLKGKNITLGMNSDTSKELIGLSGKGDWNRWLFYRVHLNRMYNLSDTQYRVLHSNHLTRLEERGEKSSPEELEYSKKYYKDNTKKLYKKSKEREKVLKKHSQETIRGKRRKIKNESLKNFRDKHPEMPKIYNKRFFEKLTPAEKERLKKENKERMAEYWQNITKPRYMAMTDEEKEEIKEKRKKAYLKKINSMTSEELKEFREDAIKRSKIWYNKKKNVKEVHNHGK